MAEATTAADRIDARRIDFERARNGERHGGERFVELPRVDVYDRTTPCKLERPADGLDRSGPRSFWRDADARPASDDGEGTKSERGCALARHHDDARGGVVQTRRVRGGNLEPVDLRMD